MKETIAVVVSGLIVAGWNCCATANLVNDGTFTIPKGCSGFVTYFNGWKIGPWTVTGGSVDVIDGYWQAPPGLGGSVDLDGDSRGGLTQTIATTAGQRYTLSFYLSGNPDGGASTKTLLVSAGLSSETLSYTTGGNTRAAMGFVEDRLNFVASGSATTLSFISEDTRRSPYGPVIGEVDVEASPERIVEPTGLALFATGLASLALIRLRA